MNPYFSIEGMAGISFFLFCAAFVLVHINRTRTFQPIDFTIISMGIVYGALFPVVIHGANTVNYIGAEFIIASRSSIIVHTIAAFIAVIGVFLGWRAMPRKRFANLSVLFSNVRSGEIVFWLYAMIVTAVLTQYLYTKDYGGFLAYFDVNRLVRAGLFDLFERSRYSFLAPFGGMAVLACYGFWGLILSKVRGALIWIGFIFSLLFSAYYLLASAGRVAMFVFVAVIIMSFMLVRRTNYLVWFIAVPLMAPVGLFSIFLIADLFGLKAADNISYFIIKELSYPFVGFFAQLKEGYLFYLFYEVLLAPVFLVPSNLTNSWVWSASDLSTFIILGGRKGTYGITSGQPTDMLTYGLMQFHLLGVAIYSFLIGYLLKVVTTVAESFSIPGLAAVATSYVVMEFGVLSIFYSQPQLIISGHFAVIAIVLAAIGLRVTRPLFSVHRRNNRR